MLSPEDIEKFHTDGYLLVPEFLTKVNVESLTTECSKIVEEMDLEEHKSVFEPGDNSNHLIDDYFLNSGDKIRFFFETSALDECGNLKYSKQQSLNKIGHALHWLNDEFKKVTFSDKVKVDVDRPLELVKKINCKLKICLNFKSLAKSLEMVDPVIIHSMYIFKDATYLYCEPANKVVGLWIALEDATEDNGCLEFIPGSHNEPVRRRTIRTETKDGHYKLTYTGSKVDYDDTKFVSVPAKKGDLILINGQVVHMSKPNTSDQDRPIYTFHVLDKHGSKFSELNWIQPSEDLPFTPLYETNI